MLFHSLQTTDVFPNYILFVFQLIILGKVLGLDMNAPFGILFEMW